jgi:RimJ/RimL family protein N-acetyltransferase
MTYKTFDTARLHLRLTALEDAPLTLALLNMPKWMKYIGDRNVRTLKEAEAYITTKMLPQAERLGFGNYTVIRKEDGVKLGCCGLYDRDGLEGVDIGFSFLGEHEKKGYAFEAASCLRDAAFADFEMVKIGAITVQENAASQRLLKKLGLKFVKNIEIGGEELMYYELLKPS